uniref:Endonuclease/exonuclease/phosphatase domain-containing protein n=1 Tax=Octopus bimaculoides TaxID=37653 RepID=A0A0L8GPG9_OCTBM
MRLTLHKNVYVTIVSVYIPTMKNHQEVKEEFHAKMREMLCKVPCKDKLIIAGDLNAGVEREMRTDDLGKHGVGKCNLNDELFLDLCSEFILVITKTVFEHKAHQKTTWMHPCSKYWHLLDYIITQRDQNDVLNTRAMTGEDYSTEHCIIRSKVTFPSGSEA